MNKKYTCAYCKGAFEDTDDWTEEKSLKEKADNGWKDLPASKCSTVCHDCYLFLMDYHNHKPGTKKENK